MYECRSEQKHILIIYPGQGSSWVSWSPTEPRTKSWLRANHANGTDYSKRRGEMVFHRRNISAKTTNVAVDEKVGRAIKMPQYFDNESEV